MNITTLVARAFDGDTYPSWTIKGDDPEGRFNALMDVYNPMHSDSMFNFWRIEIYNKDKAQATRDTWCWPIYGTHEEVWVQVRDILEANTFTRHYRESKGFDMPEWDEPAPAGATEDDNE